MELERRGRYQGRGCDVLLAAPRSVSLNEEEKKPEKRKGGGEGVASD